MTRTALVFQNTTFDVTDRNGQPWLRGLQIGAALGYADPDAVARIYARNSDGLTDRMTCTVKLTGQDQRKTARIPCL
jgi:prophage antirepressor-like protein